MTFCSARFFGTNWAIIDMLSNLFSLGWLGWYIVLVLQDFQRDKVNTDVTSEVWNGIGISYISEGTVL